MISNTTSNNSILPSQLPLIARTEGKLEDLFKTHGVKIVPAKSFDEATLAKADEEINKSVGWSHYTGVMAGANKVAVVADKIVGYICGDRYISYIAVHQDSQNKKVGEALMVDAIKSVVEKGGSTVTLDYRANNQKTKQFYKKIEGILSLKESLVEPAGRYARKVGQEKGDPRETITYYL